MKKRFYSFSVFLPSGELPLPEISVLLEKGMNGFNALVEDPYELVRKMQSGGAKVLQMNALDETCEPIDKTALWDVYNLKAGPESDLLVESSETDARVHEDPGTSDIGGGSVNVDGSEPPTIR